MKLGSLFDGIAGFPLAASRCGIEPVWASEIEAFPIEVSKRHFPNMKHLGDVTKINGAKIEPVDIITAGSPCQDLSVAGKRAGLEGERSGLFLHFIRIVKEMRDATNGQYPTLCLWENVPGALSSNKGADFGAVLEAFTETDIPIPRSGKWSSAGMVRSDKCCLAWRILDAQYHGVPQRRRRIFLVADFAGERAGQILFEPESMSGHSAESGKARQEVAAASADGVRAAGRITEPIPINDKATRYKGGGASRNGDGSGNGLGIGKPGDPMPTLTAGDRHAVAQPMLVRMREGCAGGGKEPQVVAVDCRNLRETEQSGTLQAKSTGGYSLNYQNPVRIGYAVRRLTPTECERLQGFPDG